MAVAFDNLAADEEAAREYLVDQAWKGKAPHCPRCRCTRIYRLRDQRLRCPACKYTFHDLSKRWLNFCSLTPRQWLRLMSLFVKEHTASQICEELSLSYNTVYKAMTVLRFSILARAVDASQLLHGELGPQIGFAGGRVFMERLDLPMDHIPVFGIIEEGGWAFVDLMPNLRAEHILHFNLNFNLQVNSIGNLLYTDRYQRYESLVTAGDESLHLFRLRDYGQIPRVDKRRGGFWKFAMQRIKRFHGISPRRFPLYLKELEFRYNHREENLEPLIAEYACSLVPNSK